ncbi:MAG TPA: N-acetylmannosamine-6-phosphate 2-epimerase [Chthonomonadaceae bacterium]|nr:N-acetylmannosamine-6-phosphate 2-epimerase [Chthonomonadaceae bacterium]
MGRILPDSLRGGLIVSCQAEAGTPLGTPEVLAALAAAAERGGAVGIRANGPQNLAAIGASVRVPVIGIYKVVRPPSEVYITPTFAEARAIHAAARPAIIAFDATPRPRPDDEDWRTLLRRIQTELGALAMADISTLEEGVAAAEAGADLVATTLSGYTSYTAHKKASGDPDLELVGQLAQAVSVPVICEGRVHSPEQARAALEAGALAVVVGTAITAIDWVTRRYMEAMRTGESHA